MAEIFKVTAKVKDNVTRVRLRGTHPMERGDRTDAETGELIPAKFLQEISVQHKAKTVFSAQLGSGVATDPYFSFSFAGGEKDDQLVLIWVENTGATAIETAKIK